MKQKLFTFLLLSLCQYSYCQLDTVACSSNFPAYVNDAKYIALRNIMATHNAFVDSAIIPASQYIPILEDLNAIYQYRNLYINSQYPYRSQIDSVYGPWDVHVQVPDSFDNGIEFYVDTTVAWARNIYNHSSTTGNDTIDNFVRNYGLLTSAFPLPLSNYYDVQLTDTNVTNLKPIRDTISSMAFTNSVGYAPITGDGSNIYMVDSGYARFYIFKYAYGDCPSGCIYRIYDTFTVYPGCVIGTPQIANGLNTIKEAAFGIYPNPTSGKVTIEVNGSSGRSMVRLFTSAGELIREIYLENEKSEIEFSDQSKGLYILDINTGNEVFHQKLIIY